MSVLRHAVEEAIASLWRGRRFAALATVTIATAVFVLGCFLLVTTNVEHLAEDWRSAAELSVFLADAATDVERHRIEEALVPGPLVASYEFVSKAEALARFKQMFGDMAPSVDALGGNPLPPSYEVHLDPSGDPQIGVETLAAQLRKLPGVADVRFDRQWLGRLLAAVTLVRRVGLALSAVLALAAALTVTTVVRLALHARRDELEIMELVGSPTAYVHGPFIMEGTLQGAIGGVVSVTVLSLVFSVLKARYLTPWAVELSLTSVRFLSMATCLLLVAGATLVGCLAGVMAAKTKG